MRKILAWVTIGGAVAMFVAIGCVLVGRPINSTLFLVGAVLTFGGELILKHTR